MRDWTVSRVSSILQLPDGRLPGCVGHSAFFPTFGCARVRFFRQPALNTV